MRFIVAFLCCTVLAFAQDKPTTDDKPGCGGCEVAASSGCAKATALAQKVKATEDSAAAAKMLLAEIPGFSCETTAVALVAKIKATEDVGIGAKLLMELAAKCCPEADECCPDQGCGESGCDSPDCATAKAGGFCCEKASKLASTVKATSSEEGAAQMLMAEIPGLSCAKTAAALVAKIKASDNDELCAKMIGEVANQCAKNAICPTALKLASAIRVMSNDEVAASVLVAEIKGLACKEKAGKLVAMLKKAENDEVAAQTLMSCAAKCAAKAGCGGCDKSEAKAGCGGCDKGEAKAGCGGCDKGEAKATDAKAVEAKK